MHPKQLEWDHQRHESYEERLTVPNTSLTSRDANSQERAGKLQVEKDTKTNVSLYSNDSTRKTLLYEYLVTIIHVPWTSRADFNINQQRKKKENSLTSYVKQYLNLMLKSMRKKSPSELMSTTTAVVVVTSK